MSGDELFRQDNGDQSETAVVGNGPSSKHQSSRTRGPSVGVDQYNDRFVRD